MRINLRKAAALVNEVRNTAKEIKTDTVHALNIYDDRYSEVVISQRTKLISDFNRRTRLDQAVATLRAEIGRANAASGISDLLAEDAYLESLEGRFRSMASAEPRENVATLEKLIVAKRTSAEKSERTIYGFDGGLKVNLLEPKDIEDFESKLKAVRKQRRELKDRTVDLNVRTEFEVPLDVENVLREEGLI